MPLPTTDEMMLPVLQYIADGQEYRRLNIINMLTEHFSLTEDERRRLSDGVTMERPLEHRGFIERPRTGHYRITALGLEFLNQNSAETSEPDTNTGTQENLFTFDPEENNLHPEDTIDESYRRIREKLAEDLLQQIKENTPAFFEKLVVDLLVAMGYGGSREDAGKAVGGSGDGGIDGIINEDRLGLDAIYIQAKRWGEGSVGSPDIDKFSGALNRKGASKGVFITTSRFTDSAKDAAKENAGLKIVLIDGHQLAQLMIDHDVGVSVEKTYEIKRVDSDYFAEDPKNA